MTVESTGSDHRLLPVWSLPSCPNRPIHWSVPCQCGYGSLQMVNEDAVNSNSTPFHSQCTVQFANCFHLIPNRSGVGKAGSWFSLNGQSSRYTVTYQKCSRVLNTGPLSPHRHSSIWALSPFLYNSLHLLYSSPYSQFLYPQNHATSSSMKMKLLPLWCL